MASYSVEVGRSAAKELDALPAKDGLRLLRRIQSLADDPRPPGAIRLSARERYRLREGDYRILYEIEDRTLRVVVLAVAHSRDAYW